MGHIISLITDFGIRDAYAGILKGVILGINPNATIVDISHEIEPQNISQAAYVLSTVHRYFPRGTIHVVVVDPGVGSDRKAVIIKTDEAFFVAPDNGVLGYVIGDRFEAINITSSRFWLNPISDTFHGRDIFAPVAAHLSLGVPVCEFGETLSSPVTLACSQPEVGSDGTVIGRVIHIDRFGNLITDVKRSHLQGSDIRIEVMGHSIFGLSSSYAEGPELLALIGSNGHLEIGVRNGNASDLLVVKAGDQIEVRLA
ncbi:MAG: SAM-dependent chlorinase/fluorinase [Chloroflexota bacterium]|nr:SAM-dependent chlorinase/fluorinase [Chloroflexota bacterium]